MPLTHWQHGISAQASSAVTSAAGSGDVDAAVVYCNTLSAGAISVSEESITGELAVMHFTMGSVSTARAIYAPVPIDGHVIRASAVVGATVAVNTLHTFLLNSAGTTITTLTTASGTEGKVTTATVGTGTAVAVTTADSIRVTRAAQGTTGDTWASVVIARN